MSEELGYLIILQRQNLERGASRYYPGSQKSLSYATKLQGKRRLNQANTRERHYAHKIFITSSSGNNSRRVSLSYSLSSSSSSLLLCRCLLSTTTLCLASVNMRIFSMSKTDCLRFFKNTSPSLKPDLWKTLRDKVRKPNIQYYV